MIKKLIYFPLHDFNIPFASIYISNFSSEHALNAIQINNDIVFLNSYVPKVDDRTFLNLPDTIVLNGISLTHSQQFQFINSFNSILTFCNLVLAFINYFLTK